VSHSLMNAKENYPKQKTKTCDTPGTETEFFQLLKDFGSQLNLTLIRVIFYDEGRLEVEFQTRNPWECLAFKLGSWKDAIEFLKKFPENRCFKNVVIRKKCTKCFLHERAVTSRDF
jgi:hypothetical protein